MKNLRFHSNGKFLLSGEYLILKGAEGFAVPLKFGQSLNVSESSREEMGGHINWKSRFGTKTWFSAQIKPDTVDIANNSNSKIASGLRLLLNAANDLNPKILPQLKNQTITTNLDFDINWGLGSSSTLIANIAQLFQIDAFELFFKISNGSGYDVACANAKSAILYKLNKAKPIIKPVVFYPSYAVQIYFVYLGKKQKSDVSIIKSYNRLENRDDEIAEVSVLSNQMAVATSLEEFEKIVAELEKITSKVLQIPTVKETRFSDFEGTVKSLGAWGGDFVMMTWQNSRKTLENYLTGKGLNTCFSFEEIVLKQQLEHSAKQ